MGPVAWFLPVRSWERRMIAVLRPAGLPAWLLGPRPSPPAAALLTHGGSFLGVLQVRSKSRTGNPSTESLLGTRLGLGLSRVFRARFMHRPLSGLLEAEHYSACIASESQPPARHLALFRMTAIMPICRRVLKITAPNLCARRSAP